MLGRNWLVPVTLGALIWSCSPRGELGLADSSSEDNGADGGGEPGSSASLHLESSTPGQDSSDADPNGPLELTFNAELEEGSLEAAEVTLTLDGRTVDGAATIDGTVLRFDPAEPLWLLGDYELKVGQQLRSADASLGEALTLRFRVRDGALRAVEPLVEPGSGYVGAPSIAVSANGSALVVWAEYDTTDPATASAVVARWHHPETGWTEREEIHVFPSAGAVTDTAVDINASGLAVVGWRGTTGSGIAQYRDGDWTEARTDLVPSTFVRGLNIDVLDSGVIHAAFTHGAVVAHVATNTAGEWLTPASTRNAAFSSSPYASDVGACYDADGDGFMAWHASKGTGEPVAPPRAIFFMRYRADTGVWTTQGEVAGTANPSNFEISCDQQKNALLVITGSNTTAFAYSPSDGFDSGTKVNEDGSSSNDMTSAFDGLQYVVTWAGTNATSVEPNLFSSALAPDGWTESQLVSDGFDSVSNPELEVDGRGNWLSMYIDNAASPARVVFVRRTAEGSWTRLTPNFDVTQSPIAALRGGPSGKSIAVYPDASVANDGLFAIPFD